MCIFSLHLGLFSDSGELLPYLLLPCLSPSVTVLWLFGVIGIFDLIVTSQIFCFTFLPELEKKI